MRMLVDLGAVDPAGVASALDDVLTQLIASFTAVRNGMFRHARRGHTGIGALRAALQEWEIQGSPADSRLEVRMNELLETFRLPPADFHAIVSGYEVDFLVRGTRVVLECDGFEAHGLDRDQFEFDRLRNAELTADGHVVVHFTWRQLDSAPSRVADRIERNLRQWAPDVLDAERSRRSGRDRSRQSRTIAPRSGVGNDRAQKPCG
jgi:very-short-patch-repair endonuclease